MTTAMERTLDLIGATFTTERNCAQAIICDAARRLVLLEEGLCSNERLEIDREHLERAIKAIDFIADSDKKISESFGHATSFGDNSALREKLAVRLSALDAKNVTFLNNRVAS